MSATAYIEDLSPLQIASLTQVARRRLQLMQDYSLRHVVGHILLLDNLKMEAEREKKDKMAREAFRDNSAAGSREASYVQSSAIVTVSEVAEVDRSSLQVGGQYTEPRVSKPVPSRYWSEQALPKLPTEGSLEQYEESCEVEISNESKERILKFHRYLSHLAETFEKSDDECDSDSSGESDEFESESE
jgi:hypothetical protein